MVSPQYTLVDSFLNYVNTEWCSASLAKLKKKDDLIKIEFHELS